MLLMLALLAVVASVSGRAVNVSNTWLLPEEGFPVFYRYFRDRISWYEADAVCQFHHANLVTVDTVRQYDAVRSYLKQMDITSSVWVGLIKSNADGEFTWTDYRGLSGDGYWSTAPEDGVVPLCAISDPAADFRWTAKGCGGPEVAAFICELPVPQWALGPKGCMVKIPGVVTSFVPESAAVQLTEHCSSDGSVNKILCIGDKNRQEFLRQLKCSSPSFKEDTQKPNESNLPTATESITTVKVTETSTTTHSEEHKTTFLPKETQKGEETNDFPTTSKAFRNSETTMFKFMPSDLKNDTTPIIIPLFGGKVIDIMDDNNIENNIAKHEIQDPLSSQVIYSQSNDHFIPPLVMAKAVLSEDLEVISEKRKLENAKKRHHIVSKLGVGYEPTSTAKTITTDKTTEQQDLITTKTTDVDAHALMNSLLSSQATKLEATPTQVIKTSMAPKSAKPNRPKKFNPKLEQESKTIREQNSGSGPKNDKTQFTKSLIQIELLSSTNNPPIKSDTTPDIKPDNSEDSNLEIHVLIKEVIPNLNATVASETEKVTTEMPKKIKRGDIQLKDNTDDSSAKSLPANKKISLNEEPEKKRKHDRRIQLNEKHGLNILRILG